MKNRLKQYVKKLGLFFTNFFNPKIKLYNTRYLKSGLDMWTIITALKFDPILALSLGTVTLIVYSNTDNSIDMEQIRVLTNEFYRLIESLQDFIDRFDNIVSDNNITILEERVNDSLGIEIDTEVSDEEVNRLNNILDILHDSIHQRSHQIQDILNRIQNIESRIYNFNDYTYVYDTMRERFDDIINKFKY